MFKQITKIIGKSNSKKLKILLIVMFLGSFLETIGISLMVPLCSALIEPDIIMNNEIVQTIYSCMNFASQKQFIIFVIFVLILLYVFKAIYLSLQSLYQTRFVKKCRHEISTKILKDILYRPYEFFTKINTADVTRTVYDDVNQFGGYLNNFLQVITEILVVTCIGVVLIIIDPIMTLFCCLVIGGLIGGIRYFVKKKIYKAGKLRQTMAKERLKWLNQSVQGIKDIKIARTEEFFYKKYDEMDKRFVKAEQLNQFWTKTPAYCTEAVMIVSILFYIMFLIIMDADFLKLIPNLSAFAMAAVRLLPACNRINTYLTQMLYTSASLELVYEELCNVGTTQPVLLEKERDLCETKLEKGIVAYNIDFAYEGSAEKVLENAQIEIQVGKSVGIMGSSGAGKTTVIDIILGLLRPQRGQILIDGIDITQCYNSFLSKVSYIPQTIFLLDDTIRNNVCFGVQTDKIDDEKVWEALKEASLDSFVKQLPEGLDTQIGERGIRLSGGQRQRIGIARALYSNCEILLFDEATSSLDNETEATIMESINAFKGKKTLIIIAHRLSTIADCDVIYRVENRKVEQVELVL